MRLSKTDSSSTVFITSRYVSRRRPVRPPACSLWWGALQSATQRDAASIASRCRAPPCSTVHPKERNKLQSQSSIISHYVSPLLPFQQHTFQLQTLPSLRCGALWHCVSFGCSPLDAFGVQPRKRRLPKHSEGTPRVKRAGAVFLWDTATIGSRCKAPPNESVHLEEESQQDRFKFHGVYNLSLRKSSTALSAACLPVAKAPSVQASRNRYSPARYRPLTSPMW
jgi:hypothetical protein